PSPATLLSGEQGRHRNRRIPGPADRPLPRARSPHLGRNASAAGVVPGLAAGTRTPPLTDAATRRPRTDDCPGTRAGPHPAGGPSRPRARSGRHHAVLVASGRLVGPAGTAALRRTMLRRRRFADLPRLPGDLRQRPGENS